MNLTFSPPPARATRPGPAVGLLALAAALAGGLAAPARAEPNPYYIGVSQYLGHESNIYRLGDNQSLAGNPKLSKSDTVSGTSLVAGVDQSFGRQRLYGSGSLRANRYQNNSNLNGETYGLNLALDWATVERLSGTLSVAADQSLSQFNSNSFGGVVQTKKNLVNTDQVNAKVRLGVVTRYTAEAMLGYRQRSYSAREYDRLGFNETSGLIGGRYRPSNLLNLGLALRLTKADYPHFVTLAGGGFVADRLTRQDIDLTADWQPSGNSRVTARLSPTHTRYDRNTLSNFSGLTGSADWGWQATGKTRITSTLSHDTGQSSDAINLGVLGIGVIDYGRVTTALQVRSAYDFSAKIGLTSALSYSHRTLTNIFAAANLPGSTRQGSDDTAKLTLGGQWTPFRSTQVGCDLSTERRRTGNPQVSLPMSATTFGCYGQLTLQ